MVARIRPVYPNGPWLLVDKAHKDHLEDQGLSAIPNTIVFTRDPNWLDEERGSQPEAQLQVFPSAESAKAFVKMRGLDCVPYQPARIEAFFAIVCNRIFEGARRIHYFVDEEEQQYFNPMFFLAELTKPFLEFDAFP